MQQLGRYSSPELLEPGTTIEVRDHFCELWCTGFEIADTTDRGYLVRRIADDYVLPLPFAAPEVRRAS